mmetsp:Transcript_3468/g.5802  ORF Transcript_3468/g.5802 Transcript_3468/m.5802 type:complete len:90 (-) Transcript_3468:161-430(-)
MLHRKNCFTAKTMTYDSGRQGNLLHTGPPRTGKHRCHMHPYKNKLSLQLLALMHIPEAPLRSQGAPSSPNKALRLIGTSFKQFCTQVHQ